MTHDWGHWLSADTDVTGTRSDKRWCLRCCLEHRRVGEKDPGHYGRGAGEGAKDPGPCDGFPLEHDHRGHDMKPSRVGRTYIEGGPVFYLWRCSRCSFQWNSAGPSRDPVLRMPELPVLDECGARVANQVMTS